MDRRQFIDGTIASFGAVTFLAPAVGGSVIESREADQDRMRRRLHYRISKAFPAIENDVHFVHAASATCTPNDLERCLLSAFGMAASVLLTLDSARIRDAHARRRNADLKSQRFVEIQGYLVSMAEISLRRIVDQIDPR